MPRRPDPETIEFLRLIRELTKEVRGIRSAHDAIAATLAKALATRSRRPVSVEFYHLDPKEESPMTQVQMSDRQKVDAGVDILDQDGQRFASVPEGATVTFESADPAVASVATNPDGLSCVIGSGAVGTAIVTAKVTLADGTEQTDQLEVIVTNSAPGSVTFKVGTPVDE